jgi:hypothetical protein
MIKSKTKVVGAQS